jgi:hypothetical protein
MKKQDLSIAFDSDMQFLTPAEFDETVMSEVELFREEEFNQICDELQQWDTESLNEIHSSIYRFLMTRDARQLKLATNLFLDHCIEPEGPNHFKAYLMTNTIEWILSVREFEALKAQAEFSQGEEQD